MVFSSTTDEVIREWEPPNFVVAWKMGYNGYLSINKLMLCQRVPSCGVTKHRNDRRPTEGFADVAHSCRIASGNYDCSCLGFVVE
jgi:hypothetical protein